MRLTTFFAYLAFALCATLGLSAQSVRVVFVTGQAQIQAPGETALRPLVKGEVVTLGARIVTGADGRVALTPLPGVKALITPNTDLLLESASETTQADGSVAVAATLDLKQGAVVTDILKQEGVTYDYNVRTPRGLAGARGTNYTVGVNAAGIETVVVSEGAITFNLLDGRQLSVTAGQITITDASGAVRQAASLGELSAADQAFAQEIADATLEALESAIEAGIEINPAAIDQALQLFESFGLDVSDSTLQLVSRLRAAIENLRDQNDTDDETSTIVTEQRMEDDHGSPTGSPYEVFVASLDQTQSAAFTELIDRGGFDSASETFLARFSNSGFTSALRETINLYAGLTSPERDQAVALGILGDANETAIGADSAGLSRLIQSYTSKAPSGSVAQLDEAPFGAGTNSALVFTDNFFSGVDGNSGLTIYNVSFGDVATDSDLTVGATRFFRLENNATFYAGENVTNFEVADGRDITVRASDEVSLAGMIETPVAFSSAARGVLIEAVTINLANVNFAEGSVIVLTSRDGGVASTFNSAFKIPNFGSSVVGRVNFLGGVFYGDTILDGDEAFVIGSRGNIRIASFSDGLNPAFPDYTPPTPTAEEAFAANLTTEQLAIFNSLPPEVRTKLVDLDDSDITGLLLGLDPETAVPLTSTDINRVLDIYTPLSTDARAFIKTLAGGPGLPNIDGTPDILNWSSAAFESAAAVFNNLDSTTQNALVAMGAGEAIMGLNGDYIQGLTIVSGSQVTAISESGWGNYLDKLVSDEALSSIDEAAAGATAAQRELIRLLRIDPYRLAEVLNIYEGNTAQLYARLDLILAEVSAPDLTLLSQLGFDDTFSLFSSIDPVADIDAIVAHYNGLSPEQQTAARALRLGSVLIDATRAGNITNFYLGLDLAEQEAMRDADLVTAFFYTENDDSVIQAAVTTAIASYLGLDPVVQNYLLGEAGSFDLLAVLNSDSGHSDDAGKNLRSLSEIASIIENVAATPADLETLQDLDLGRAVLFDGYLDSGAPTPADAVRDALVFFRALSPSAQGTLRELGIVGANHVGFLGSDYSGVTRLINAYAALPTAVRVDTLHISDGAASYASYDEKVSYFLPYNKDFVLENVSFASPGDLHVGAVRRLRIDNSLISEPSTTFLVDGDHTANIHLRAGDLIDLNNTPIASNARGITMEAITINLANIHFAEGSTAALTSRDGGLHFGSSVVGGVNFLSNVTYGGFLLDSQPNFDANSRGNIAIGSFAAPATLPDYTAPIAQ